MYDTIIRILLWLVKLQNKLVNIQLQWIKDLQEPCGYCGKSNDPNDICSSCFPGDPRPWWMQLEGDEMEDYPLADL